MFLGGGVHDGLAVETQQAFLEGHVQAFEWFDGVFAEVRSHYLFDSLFTTPGIEGAHEKGGVEGEVGRFRRNHLVRYDNLGSAVGRDGSVRRDEEGAARPAAVPVPEVGSIAQLNGC